ncbi:alkyl hydroperoxide reductase/ Thiol specific antioxidant/ Mal allergen [mine drainage metagenome]|uniref:Alkyl hydroperoxide reductase/ Thiol specific antioxidant/ Mal allergen n=2 Tax=mine drainage metagenome TaxID=410659 RepID=T1C8T3_9ZZZZ
MPKVDQKRCPECDVSVREDRIVRHLTNAHPGKKIPKDLLGRPNGRGRSGRKGRDLGSGWSKRRLIFTGVAIAIVILVIYAIFRAPAIGPQNGKLAPDFTFTDLQGNSHSLSGYQGTPVVLWYVALFCGSCIQGSQLFAQQYYSQYHGAGVTLLEVESYNDLGQSGPSLAAFASQVGYSDQPGWILGSSSSDGTNTYNPNGYLDVYYVLNAQGTIVASGQGLSGAFGSALQQA